MTILLLQTKRSLSRNIDTFVTERLENSETNQEDKLTSSPANGELARRAEKGTPDRGQCEPRHEGRGRRTGEGLVGGQDKAAGVPLEGARLVLESLALSQSVQVVREAGPPAHHQDLPTGLRRN